MVRLRGGFSDTHGISPRNNTLQIEEFDDDTRTKISNKLFMLIQLIINHIEYFYNECATTDSINRIVNSFCRELYNDVFCKNNRLKDGYHYDWEIVYESINDVIMNSTYNEVLDILQYTCNWFYSSVRRYNEDFYPAFNQLFEQECVGYRFVNGRIVAITDEQEIETIEEACNNTIEGCRAQIRKAVDILSDRERKDYKNSIKESISAVESICQAIVGDESATLDTALKRLESKGLIIHPALRQAFSKLYGYTSDQGGVRHAEGMFESNVTFEEAKYMLVSCSAFINYLIAEMGKGDS